MFCRVIEANDDLRKRWVATKEGGEGVRGAAEGVGRRVVEKGKYRQTRERGRAADSLVARRLNRSGLCHLGGFLAVTAGEHGSFLCLLRRADGTHHVVETATVSRVEGVLQFPGPRVEDEEPGEKYSHAERKPGA